MPLTQHEPSNAKCDASERKKVHGFYYSSPKILNTLVPFSPDLFSPIHTSLNALHEPAKVKGQQ